MSNRGPHFHSSADMAPADVVWESRDVALPAWMWRTIDEAAEMHRDHPGCWQNSVDNILAMGARYHLGDPTNDYRRTQVASMGLLVAMVHQIVHETTERPVCSIEEWSRYFAHLVHKASDFSVFMTNEDVSVFIADAAVRVAVAQGHRLSLVEDLNTVIAGVSHDGQKEAFMAAVRRLGGNVDDVAMLEKPDADEG